MMTNPLNTKKGNFRNPDHRDKDSAKNAHQKGGGGFGWTNEEAEHLVETMGGFDWFLVQQRLFPSDVFLSQDAENTPQSHHQDGFGGIQGHNKEKLSPSLRILLWRQ